ncbi:acetylcholine receptor subunit alpha-L1 [Aphis craccivora]|uniref:Acetylcholine receptor subunit alpha-L1 n=1 Tax=Aphis craccivora TaxID=307492 RepID=A0A6G0ZJ42_APHCR|nr:acetylcholine receptor subunit alpha-L1 [Aphis craccivora]
MIKTSCRTRLRRRPTCTAHKSDARPRRGEFSKGVRATAYRSAGRSAPRRQLRSARPARSLVVILCAVRTASATRRAVVHSGEDDYLSIQSTTAEKNAMPSVDPVTGDGDDCHNNNNNSSSIKKFRGRRHRRGCVQLTSSLPLLLLSAVGCLCNPDAKRLYDDLLSNYNRLIRPVSNNTDTVLVKLGLRLSQLIELVRHLDHGSHRCRRTPPGLKSQWPRVLVVLVEVVVKLEVVCHGLSCGSNLDRLSLRHLQVVYKYVLITCGDRLNWWLEPRYRQSR